MKTNVVANQKGGIGKTSTAVQLAFDAMERSLRTVFIDLDPQANASDALEAYGCTVNASMLFADGADVAGMLAEALKSEPQLLLIQADDLLANLEKKEFKDVAPNFKHAIQVLGELGFDLCLIDTPPTIGNALAAALYAADYVLCPIEPERFSMKGIKKMYATITNIRRFNPDLKFLGMVPNMVDGRKIRHRENVAALRESYPDLVTPVSVGLRDSIADAMADGIPVWHIKKTAARKAAKEVRELAKYVFEKMEIV